jgi:hypothetical protein
METTETFIGSWTIASATLAKFAGRPFKIFARWYASLDGAEMIARMKWNSATTVSETPRVTLSSSGKLTEIGTMYIPPFLPEKMYTGSQAQALVLMLYGNKTTAGTVKLDYLMLVPVDNYIKITDANVGVSPGGTLYIDGITRDVYSVDSIGNYSRSYAVEGTWPTFEPDKSQALVVMYDQATGASDITKAASIRVYMRQRRRLP